MKIGKKKKNVDANLSDSAKLLLLTLGNTRLGYTRTYIRDTPFENGVHAYTPKKNINDDVIKAATITSPLFRYLDTRFFTLL